MYLNFAKETTLTSTGYLLMTCDCVSVTKLWCITDLAGFGSAAAVTDIAKNGESASPSCLLQTTRFIISFFSFPANKA